MMLSRRYGTRLSERRHRARVNGLVINDFDDALTALATFTALAEDEYRVTIERSGMPMEIFYTVVP